MPARGKERIQLFLSILALAVKLANKRPDYVFDCLLARIVEVEVEVEQRLV